MGASGGWGDHREFFYRRPLVVQFREPAPIALNVGMEAGVLFISIRPWRVQVRAVATHGNFCTGAPFSSGAAAREGAAVERSPWKRGIRSHIGFHLCVRGRILMKDLRPRPNSEGSGEPDTARRRPLESTPGAARAGRGLVDRVLEAHKRDGLRRGPASANAYGREGTRHPSHRGEIRSPSSAK